MWLFWCLQQKKTSKINLTLTDDLDDEVFDYPLLLRTEIPSSWKKVKIAQGKNVQKIIPVIENGINYVYYEAIPDKGDIKIVGSSKE